MPEQRRGHCDKGRLGNNVDWPLDEEHAVPDLGKDGVLLADGAWKR